METIKNVLIIGKGVIGTLYAYLFKSNDINTSHLVRSIPDYKRIYIDLLNVTKEAQAYFNDTYEYNFVTKDNVKLSNYDLIIIPVRHYQIKEVFELLNSISKNKINIPVLVFGNVWDKLEDIEKLHNDANKVLFGMPRGGGSISRDVLKGAVLKDVILEKNSKKEKHLQAIRELFSSIKRNIVEIDKIQDWYWSHLATTLAWICGAVKAQGFDKYSKSFSLIKESIKIGKKALEIVKARGGNIEVCEDIKPFLLPDWLSAFIVMIMLKRKDAAIISQGHGDNNKEELYRIYQDILNTGKDLKVDISLLESYEKYFEEMLKHKA